jgi:sporulation protein YlmC with PRC-barrel domain
VSGYHIQAKDGEIGHVEDFIIDDETWAIRYLELVPNGRILRKQTGSPCNRGAKISIFRG